MKQLHGNSLILGAAALTFLAAQPAWAQTTQVSDVKVNPVDGGISVVLRTSSGSRPQIFTTKRGKNLVSDIINAQLRLPRSNSFRQDKPAPGITSVEVIQLDANSIRVIVTGDNDAPVSQPVARNNDRITLGFAPSTGTVASAPTPTTPPANVPVPVQPNQKPEVLVPNPQITIDGKPAQAAGTSQPVSQAPPFLPGAVAPPVGPIAMSSIDASPTTIDLGTQERVPRLVLRDAPVREVLSLLARAANLNLAYISGDPSGGQPGAAPANGAISQTISLDIENEPVQDVFNYVLRLSGLEANRNGRTVFVGPKLPNSTRDVVVRSLRLNQVNVGVALNFLVGMGAESTVTRERQVTNVSAVPVGAGSNPITQTQTTTETRIERLTLDESQYTTPLLRGLQALGDERTNSITLIGPAKQIDMAISQLIQLDIRRRQVAVNVKIVDVNLLNTLDKNASFSFGFGNNYFTNDGGAASFNFGGSRPATGAEVAASVTATPVIQNPVTGETFLGDRFFNPRNGLPAADPSASSNPLQPGISNFTPGVFTNQIVPIDIDERTGQPTRFGFQPTTTNDTYTFSLPTLYQFPRRFLASLQAQVTSGNAKILTDPTLIVQEGQTANVKLTQEVLGNIVTRITSTDNISTQTITAEKTDVGLTLAVKIDRIDDNGFISLSVAPVIKAPQSSADLNVGGGNFQRIFLVSERSLNSGLIRLRDGQTLILSGIIQDQDRVSVSKIPILGDLPLIGSLFRRTNKDNQRQEVIVLLTPQVMDDSQENSSFGYNYTPSPAVRDVLERRGLGTPKR